MVDLVPTSVLLTLTDIEAAEARVRPMIRRTPLLESSIAVADSPLSLKAESLQRTGSFKLRGASNAIAQLSTQERARGVITHSSGNHAQALARAARDAGVPATIVMPKVTPAVKLDATASYGAEIVLIDDAGDRASTMERLRAESGAVFIAPYDHPAIIAGQGTVGLEIVEDAPAVATIYVPVSGGGLVSGIAAAAKARRPEVRVVAVEPELAGDLAEGRARGERAIWPAADTGRTIADGLRTTSVGLLNWEHIAALVDDVITVTDDEILAAMRRIVLDDKLVCEPSGAVSVAGYLADLRRTSGLSVAVVSGGNVEPRLLAEVVGGAEPRRLASLPAGGWPTGPSLG
jgi:threonine dehydratase